MYDAFFDYARKRQSALIQKRAGVQKGQQSLDPIINHYKFCNVFREDDRTTIWLREHVRERMVGKPELLLATILFRWFNRITTGEAIFTKEFRGKTGWDHYLEATNEDLYEYATEVLKNAILAGVGTRGPYVTGAYCIIGMPHMSKLDGILACVRNVVEQPSVFDTSESSWKHFANLMLNNPGQVSMQSVWDWFRLFPRSGDFMAYEIVTDLQHSPGFLDQAPDRMTWANAGPGAIRGLNRIYSRPLEQQHSKQRTNEEMRAILDEAIANTILWPTDWPAWDMRTVEHTLCEFDKYERLRLKQGTVKGVYR